MRISRNGVIVLVLLQLAILLGAILGMAWLYDRWTIPGPNGPERWVGMDFVVTWVGVREMLSGQSPYSSQTLELIQQTVLGGLPEPGGDPMMFVYPAWVFLFYAPLALLPLKWAVAVTTGILLAGSLDFIGYLAYRWGNIQPRRMMLWTLLLIFGSLPFLAISVTKGQMGLVSLAGLAAALWLWERRPTLAGAALGIAFFKPTVAVIPILGFLLWALIERKPRIIIGFVAGLGILALASFIAIGNWLPDYLALLTTTGGAPVLWSLAFLPWPWKAFFILLFVGLAVFAFIISLRRRDRTPWLSASVLAGIALFPMRWIYDLLFGILIALEEKDVRGAKAISLAAALLAPWLFALLPREIRWQAEVTGMPLIWAIAWWTFFHKSNRSIPKVAAERPDSSI